MVLSDVALDPFILFRSRYSILSRARRKTKTHLAAEVGSAAATAMVVAGEVVTAVTGWAEAEAVTVAAAEVGSVEERRGLC